MCDTDALNALGLRVPITSKYLDENLTSSSSTTEILSALCVWLVQEFYLDCDSRTFNTATDFVDVREYDDPDSNKTGAQVASQLLQNFNASWESVQEITSKFDSFASAKFFSFPVLTKVDASSGYATLALKLPINTIDGLEPYVQTWLDNFYGDSQWGAYSTNMTNGMSKLENPLYKAGSLQTNSAYDVNYTDADGKTAQFLYGFTLKLKLSFLPCLYQLIAENTNTGDFTGSERSVLLGNLTSAQFDSLKVGDSVPYPVTNQRSQTDYCASTEDCACLYFVVFKSKRSSSDMPLTTPAHNLYINRFQGPNCLCYVSRATTLGDANNVLNSFGLCFDQNCLDPAVDRSNFDLACEAECVDAQQNMSGVNWQNNYVNPGTINLKHVENTCNMSISPISYDTDRWQPFPYLIAGAACLVLSVPAYILVSSIVYKRYVFSIWHILLFLLTSGIGVLGVYGLAGKYVCSMDISQLDRQASCVDRLTGLLPLSKECCDTADPIFCQCDPTNSNQQVCHSAVASTFCKCQNNGLCIPTSGNSDILTQNPILTQSFNYQIIFLLIAIFVLLTPLTTIAISPLLQMDGTTNWVWTIVIYVLTVIMSFLVIVVIPALLTYKYVYERTFVVDTEKQALTCATNP